MINGTSGLHRQARADAERYGSQAKTIRLFPCSDYCSMSDGGAPSHSLYFSIIHISAARTSIIFHRQFSKEAGNNFLYLLLFTTAQSFSFRGLRYELSRL